jgi:hypothetical protein
LPFKLEPVAPSSVPFGVSLHLGRILLLALSVDWGICTDFELRVRAFKVFGAVASLVVLVVLQPYLVFLLVLLIHCAEGEPKGRDLRCSRVGRRRRL